MKKARSIVLSSLISIGLVMLLVGLAFGVYYEKSTEGMIPVEGTVIGWVDGYPLIAYDVNGLAYQMVGSINANPQIGDPYSLMVNPDNPADCRDQVFLILMWVFAAIGPILAAAGLIVHGCMGRRQQRREELLGYGRRAIGTVVSIKEVKNVSVGNRHPWVATATCVHPLTGESVTLRSHYLWTCSVVAGQHIDIAFDPMNEKKYAMDIREEGEAWA